MGSSASGPGNSRSTVKECKEKRKQDKIAGLSYHAETRPEAVKMGKGKRKRDREDEEPPPGDKKEKKKRKEGKTSAAASNPVSTVLTADLPLEAADISEVTGVIAATSEAKERKKRKKNKSSTETSDDPASSAVDPAPSTNAADKSKKPQKRKSPKDDTANADAEAKSSSESKSKKRTKREVVQGEDHHQTASTPEDPSHKRKKRKKSTHPDPSDDPDLTEQSRKALTYIHSQSTLPETWKFSKARQNWIVRNVWTSKIPEKYVPMVVDYLSKVQGRVRETLIESCNKVISDSNVGSPVSQARVNEGGSSENTDPPTPDAVGSEKVQRARVLLHALTKNHKS